MNFLKKIKLYFKRNSEDVHKRDQTIHDLNFIIQNQSDLINRLLKENLELKNQNTILKQE